MDSNNVDVRGAVCLRSSRRQKQIWWN